jgi:hypothetical protein
MRSPQTSLLTLFQNPILHYKTGLGNTWISAPSPLGEVPIAIGREGVKNQEKCLVFLLLGGSSHGDEETQRPFMSFRPFGGDAAQRQRGLRCKRRLRDLETERLRVIIIEYYFLPVF